MDITLSRARPEVVSCVCVCAGVGSQSWLGSESWAEVAWGSRGRRSFAKGVRDCVVSGVGSLVRVCWWIGRLGLGWKDGIRGGIEGEL